MTRSSFHSLAATSLLILAAATCTTIVAQDKHDAHAKPATLHAVCHLQPTEGNKTAGVVHFTEHGGKVMIAATITGLTPNQKHAIHIHEFGDVSDAKGMATGGHYNPEGHDHGLPDKDKRHAGDLGNLEADGDGKATLKMTVDNITIAGAKNAILGRAIIVHAKPDDGGQPVGNAGPRITQGVIGVAKPPAPAKPAGG